ncbi:MAG: hydroxyacid dehydrogenase [Spirochaetales bacterium]|nr:hydroxyacid dehydrogenase [Spirochaetales bacterium]
MKRVLITQKVPDEALALLQGRAELVFSPSPDEKTVAGLIADCDAVLVRTATKLGRQTLSSAGKMKLISRTGTGVDNVDVESATDNGIIVCNTPSANTKSVAEHTVTLMFSLLKQIVKLNKETKSGNWSSRDTDTGTDLNGKNLGLVGFGRIGQMVAKMTSVFGMKIHFFDPVMTDMAVNKDYVCHKELNSLLSSCDILSLHLPLIKSTRNIIGSDEIALMKKGSYIINTSRGGLINEEALIEGINSGQLRGAGLDVFEDEPVKKDNPLCKVDNIIMTPHAAALTPECKLNVAVEAVRNILDFLDNGKPSSVVNPEVLDKD